MTVTRSDERVLLHVEDGVGRITLNRPEALNAVDLPMLEVVTDALEAWREDSEVQIVLFDGVGDRGFSAGGDVRRIYELLEGGDQAGPEAFFRTEYQMNATIAEYPKPVVAFADGVTMGGGIGMAGHAHVRVVTETSKLAMPETRIGFTPDAGGSWLLAHAPGRIGEYLALTSATMGPFDAIYAGFADHYVPRGDLGAIRHALATRADPSTPTELVMLFDETPDDSPLQAARAWIDDAFALDSVAAIRERLRELSEAPRWRDADPSPASALAALTQRPPVATTVTLAAIRSSRALPNLRAALTQEYRLVGWFSETQPDMREGIRAQMIDKDHQPRWSPATIEELPETIVGDAFTHQNLRALFS
ncbi:enoyl-CoA hydratase/isomerase family protein [Microbacterium amylolyticum]|uniref:3-hydroxyisobutyryl-CoA hydrolase n=1 Tax=Microbacterium amylolyticum TaxID=936337 RepID=A0ABS4ZHB7_9MICO|nr:enoyl-CoA hydratase/isomerase family protein [Microbacterium amylolyticum]MBP2436675.1 enoyl-CoA hydratase [Microbacterium amylolyticum]